MLVGFVVLAGIAVWMLWSIYLEQPADSSLPDQAAFEDETGIRILRVVMIAAGGLVDLQYQVLDPDKSLVVHDDENPPTLINEEDGRVLNIPFHEHGFQELHTARTYRLHIMNADNVLQRGDTVTILIGDARLEHIAVQ